MLGETAGSICSLSAAFKKVVRAVEKMQTIDVLGRGENDAADEERRSMASLVHRALRTLGREAQAHGQKGRRTVAAVRTATRLALALERDAHELAARKLTTRIQVRAHTEAAKIDSMIETFDTVEATERNDKFCFINTQNAGTRIFSGINRTQAARVPGPIRLATEHEPGDAGHLIVVPGSSTLSRRKPTARTSPGPTGLERVRG
ncbi:hypothetical protein ERJ75_001374600 [Trypanosoma vivax]|nr:hypothetical protein ERJ75_001374600 [Trypanosoma vivax]